MGCTVGKPPTSFVSPDDYASAIERKKRDCQNSNETSSSNRLRLPDAVQNSGQSFRLLTLANDLRVALVSDPKNEQAGCCLQVGVGSLANREFDCDGLAHLLEHMLLLLPCDENSNSTRQTSSSFYDFVAKLGGKANAQTKSESTVYYFTLNETSSTNAAAAKNSATTNLETAIECFANCFASTGLKNLSPVLNASSTSDANTKLSPLEREIHAVHSEFFTKINSDVRRERQVLLNEADKSHALNSFATGNLDTLAVNDVTQKLQKLHRKYYSGNLMSVCILGNNSLDELEKIAVENFGKIPNFRSESLLDADNSLKTWGFLKYFFCDNRENEAEGENSIDNILPVQVFIEPAEMSRIFAFQFFIYPSNYSDSSTTRKIIPDFITNLISSAHEDGLLSSLKTADLVSNLSARFIIDVGATRVFEIRCELTAHGANNLEKVGEMLFGFLAALKEEMSSTKNGKQKIRELYEEAREISNLNFRFQQSKSCESLVQFLAQNLTTADEEQNLYSAAEMLYPDLEEEIMLGGMRDFLNFLTVDNLRLSVMHKDATLMYQCVEVEKAIVSPSDNGNTAADSPDDFSPKSARSIKSASSQISQDRFYGTIHTDPEPLDLELVSKWRNAEKSTSSTTSSTKFVSTLLPPKNTWIPTVLTLCTNNSIDSNKSEKKYSTNKTTTDQQIVDEKTDTYHIYARNTISEFAEPRAAVDIRLYFSSTTIENSSSVNTSNTHKNFQREMKYSLIFRALENYLHENLAGAIKVGYTLVVKYDPEVDACCISAAGFSDKILDFLVEMTDAVGEMICSSGNSATSQVDNIEKHFKSAAEYTLQGLEHMANVGSDPLNQIAQKMREKLVVERHNDTSSSTTFSWAEKLSWFRDNMAEKSDFGKIDNLTLGAIVFADVFIEGNMSARESCEKIKDDILSTFRLYAKETNEKKEGESEQDLGTDDTCSSTKTPPSSDNKSLPTKSDSIPSKDRAAAVNDSVTSRSTSSALSKKIISENKDSNVVSFLNMNSNKGNTSGGCVLLLEMPEGASPALTLLTARVLIPPFISYIRGEDRCVGYIARVRAREITKLAPFTNALIIATCNPKT